MATEITKQSTNYKVTNKSESIILEGDLVYNNVINDKIDSLSINITNVEDGSYIGNIFYQEDEDGNTSMNTNLGFSYMMDSITMLQTIINDIKSQINQ